MVCEFLNIFSLGSWLLLYVTIELMLVSMRAVIKILIVTVCSGVNRFLLATILLGALFLFMFVFSSIHFCAFVCV